MTNPSTNRNKFQLIQSQLDSLSVGQKSLSDDMKLIKTELLGDVKWSKDGVLKEHKKNTKFRNRAESTLYIMGGAGVVAGLIRLIKELYT